MRDQNGTGICMTISVYWNIFLGPNYLEYMSKFTFCDHTALIKEDRPHTPIGLQKE